MKSKIRDATKNSQPKRLKLEDKQLDGDIEMEEEHVRSLKFDHLNFNAFERLHQHKTERY